MAQPNIVSVSSILGTTQVGDLSTTLTTTLVTAASDKVLKMNVIRCTNITDNDATVTLDVEVSGTHKKIANEVTVPANSVVDIVLYLHTSFKPTEVKFVLLWFLCY